MSERSGAPIRIPNCYKRKAIPKIFHSRSLVQLSNFLAAAVGGHPRNVVYVVARQPWRNRFLTSFIISVMVSIRYLMTGLTYG